MFWNYTMKNSFPQLFGFLFKLEKADNVVKTMIDHMSDVQSGATYKLSLKLGQLQWNYKYKCYMYNK